METNFDFTNDVGKQNARMIENRHKNLSIEEKQAINSYFNTFHMYCENNIIERFRRLQEKLAHKNLMFKFNGNKYAIHWISLIGNQLQITNFHWKMWKSLQNDDGGVNAVGETIMWELWWVEGLRNHCTKGNKRSKSRYFNPEARIETIFI